MRSTILRWLVPCLLFAGTMPLLEAGRLTVSTQVQGIGAGLDQNPVVCGSAPGQVNLAFTSVTSSCAGNTQIKSGVFAGLNFDVGGMAYAAASPDTLHASASINAGGAPFDNVWHPHGAISFAEANTINGFWLPGGLQLGWVTFAFSLEGLIGGTFDTFSGGRLEYDPLFSPVQEFLLNNGNRNIVTQPVPINTHFAGFGYILDLYVQASLCDSCNSKSPAHLYTGSANVDFSNTVKLVGMSLTDINGNPITGITISSVDGTDYTALLNAGTSSVPEPSTGAAALVLLAIVVTSRRRIR